MRWFKAVRWCGAGAAALLWWAPARAAELHSQGPAPCPDREELGFRVERAIGMPLGRAAALRFEVVFERSQASYAAQLRVTGAALEAPKERRLTARDCSQLADAVSVAIALALGASDALPDAQPPAAPEPAAPAPVSVPAAPALPEPLPDDLAAAPAAPRSGRLVPALQLGLVLDGGSLPALGLGLGLSAELRAQRFALRASGVLLFEQHLRLPATGGAAPGVDLGLAFGSLSACAAPLGSTGASFAAQLCAGWELGRIDGTGSGVPGARPGSQLWSAPSADAGVSWAIPGTLLRFGARLTLAVPLERDDFVLGDFGPVYRVPSAVGRLTAGLDVGFD